MRPISCFRSVVALCFLAPVAASAQLGVRVAPQFQMYNFSDYDRTVSQLAIPIAAEFPIFSRMSLEVGTAFAHSKVESGATTSEISGLTDTQLRSNLSFGADNVVLTAGLSLPTGQSTVAVDEVLAAGLIGSEFLVFPIPSMGSGLAATGGVAFARNFGAWNLGVGAAYRHAQEFEPFQSADTTPNVRYQPGSEMRARAGIDRAIGDAGQLSLGFTYSKFTDDEARAGTQAFTFNSGDRYITQLVFGTRLRGAELFLSAWDMIISKGLGVSGETPGQNIINAAASMGWPVGRITVEPNVEARLWTVGGSTRISGSTTTQVSGGLEGIMGVVGVRSRVPAGPLVLYPGVSFSMGKLGRDDAAAGTTSSSLTGLKGTLTAHFAR
jgi:hypothetical protein